MAGPSTASGHLAFCVAWPGFMRSWAVLPLTTTMPRRWSWQTDQLMAAKREPEESNDQRPTGEPGHRRCRRPTRPEPVAAAAGDRVGSNHRHTTARDPDRRQATHGEPAPGGPVVETLLLRPRTETEH